MYYPKNEIIAQNLFMTLWLDYESEYGVSCRVLNDLYFYGHLYAESREAAIDKFYKGEYTHEK